MVQEFLAPMPPMNRKRAENALEMMVRVNGCYSLVSRASLIEQRVSEGAVMAARKGEPILQRQDGAFLDARQITKTGLDYANFLLSR
jgi:hypothetical protein